MTKQKLPTLVSDGAMTLVVGWRSGLKMKLGRLPMSIDVEQELEGVVEAADEGVASRDVEGWTPEADDSNEVALVMPVANVGAAPPLARDVAVHGTLLNALARAADLPRLTPQSLPVPELDFYAIVVGDDPDKRTAWIRRTNARRGLKKGRTLTYFREALEKVEDPIFGFDNVIDMIASEGSLVVLSQGAFKAMFRGNADLKAQVPQWIGELSAHLPLAEDGATVLAERCHRDGRLKRRLEAIRARGHLANVTKKQLLQEMAKFNVDTKGVFNRKGELDLSKVDIPDLLKVLNEDLFTGGLSGSTFRADKKAPH